MTTLPPSFHDDAQQGFRTPFSFLRESLPGGFDGLGLQLMGAWALAALLPAWFWARHLAAFAGRSALPSHWGERLPAKDILELWWNGKWNQDPFGTLPILALLLCLAWFLWSGWRMQAALLGRRPTTSAWCLGLLEACLLGLIPLGIVHWLIARPLDTFGGLGIAPLSWSAFFLKPLFLFAFTTALSLQWSLCRVERLAAPRPWIRHMRDSFLALWTHPIQWTLLALGAAGLRVGLSSIVLLLGWRWGGAGAGRILAFALAQAVAAAIVAWTLGWQLRLTALFARHDAAVREEQHRLSETSALAEEAPVEG